MDNSVAMRWLCAVGSESDRQYAGEVAAWVEASIVHAPAMFVSEAVNVISRALNACVINPQEYESRFDLLKAVKPSVDPMEAPKFSHANGHQSI